MRVPIIVSHPRCQLTAPLVPKFPSTSCPQRGGSVSDFVMQEQHLGCFIRGTEAAEVTPLMESYMLLLSANAESGNVPRS
uniref:Uncharacterized protein n=1 Tax=Oryza meridionalis TaxID=40149 RepID=A0A0E0EL47_9ORYZ